MTRRKVTASQLAELSFCETKVMLRAKYGDRDTATSRQLREGGAREHARFHREVLAHHNKTVQGQDRSTVDRRCFVATAVYGVDDPRTEQLRRYRDERLVTKAWGRWLVAAYYALSPTIVRLLDMAPWLKPLAVRMLDHTRHRIVQGDCKEAMSHGDERLDPEEPPAGH